MSEESKPYVIDESTKVKLNFPEIESSYAAEEADDDDHIHTSAYWLDIDHIKQHLQQYKQSLLGDPPKRMPTAKELSDTGFNDLVRAIDDYHGGFKRVAEILGYDYQPQS